MKILHLTTAHADDDVRIYIKEVSSLAQHYDTALIAPRRSERIYSDITYLPLTPARSRMQRLLLQREALRLVKQFGPDVVHLHDPELLFLGLYFKLQGLKVIWDVHEDLPKQMQKKAWIPAVLKEPGARVVQILEKTLVPQFDAVVSATPSIAKKFSSHPLSVTVRNYPRLEEFSSHKESTKKAQFIYAGGISPERGAKEMAQAISQLRQAHNAQLAVAGRFATPELESYYTESEGIICLGWLRRDEISKVYSESLAGIVALHATPNHLEALPIKMFEYMAAGLPVIASDFPLWRSIINKYQCGLLINPDRPEELAAAMRWILEHKQEASDMGRRGRLAIESELNWDYETDRLIGMYRSLEQS
ncbi:glycosyltransferase family 4 protein [Deinococcus lacus]|uniref:Glycosyltransferase family 4 protein n=1 Tax=Deinococcus lacus TaxID=392561 RepID=A0ABW1YFE7_9DEIO